MPNEVFRTTLIINETLFDGYEIIMNSGNVGFVYKDQNTNIWNLWSITEEKTLANGYKTRKELLEDIHKY